MERTIVADENQLFKRLGSIMRKCIFRMLSVGAIPNHIAFILDGNRRHAKKHNLTAEGASHRAGFFALMSMLKYCYEFGVKYVTIFAFSIDNYRRRHTEVQFLMDLMLQKIEVLLLEQRFLNQYGIRICFIGNMELLNEPIRVAAEKVMRATAKNSTTVIQICLAYTSTHEIIHAVQETCIYKLEGQALALQPSTMLVGVTDGAEQHEIKHETARIKLVHVEKHMYTRMASDPDIIIRTSGENRLSKFLLWQSSNCLLYSTAAL